MPRSSLAGSLAAVFVAALAFVSTHDAAAQDSSRVAGVDVSQLHFRYIGPPGNRVSAVIGEPGNPNVYFAGAASGGIWKSVDGGIDWRPVFDKMPAQSIGALAMAPSDHEIMWAGTGEPFIRSNVSIGDGVYKSTDGGETWTHMGLDHSGRIARIVIDPRDPNIVLVAAEGAGYGPSPERGVYRTTDGGATWRRVLFVDEHTGASDLAMDPRNPRVLFAGMWQFVIHTWGKYSGGPGSGVFVSRDGGATWHRLTGHGLPTGPVGKVAVAIAPSDPSRVYALMETGWEGRGSLWRSDDGGRTWTGVSDSHLLAERPHYYTRLMVSPTTPNEIYFPSNFMLRSLDGGETAEVVPWGGDNHDMWADPTNGDRMMIGFDGGVAITTTHGRSWHHVVLPIAQMYHVAVDDRIPYWVYGNEQDFSAVTGPSNSRGFGRIASAMWHTTAGCESGFSYPDPVDTMIVWGGCYSGGIERYNLQTRQSQSVDPWPDRPLDAPADSIRYRWNWTPPLALSPFDHNTVYVGSQYVHRTTDGGHSWQVISPDLTTNDTARLGSSGGLTDDNLGVEYFSTLFAIAESPVQHGVIWTGSNDGVVSLTRDGGAHWTNVSRNITGFPKWGTVSNVEPSHFEAGRAYISVDGHQQDDRDPYIFETTDFGAHWRKISDGIPRSVFSYVGMVAEDPVRKGMLYAGTENALYVTLDDGAHWYPLQTNLPHAPVSWITVQRRFDDLVLSTKGRGVWILDDISPLQRLGPSVAASPAFLFPPRDAYRFRSVSRITEVPNDQAAGRNPPYGAVIDYYLKTAPRVDTVAPPAPAAHDYADSVHQALFGAITADSADSARRARAGKMHITILDAQGRVVRKLEGPARAGINRVWWDLRYQRTAKIALRTTPPGYPQIWSDKRFIGKRTRPIFHYGIEQPVLGPLAAPGTYTVRIVAGRDTLSQPLRVLKDPHSAGTLADIHAATAMSLALRDEIDTVVHAVNRIENVRKQLEDLHDAYGRDSLLKPLLAKARALDGKLVAVENELLQPVVQEGDRKTYRAPMRLYLKLLFLAGDVGTGAGDVAGSPDLAPTQQEVDVHRLLQARLSAVMTRLQAVMTADVPAFYRELAAQGRM